MRPRPDASRALVATVLLAATAIPPRGAARADPVPTEGHHYRLDVRLDVDTHTVSGRLWIQFVNTSERPIDALELHLYANAFEHAQTVFMREGGARIRRVDLTDPGHIHLTDIHVAGRPSVAALQTDMLPFDRTQARLPLAKPLAPGGSLSLRMDFETKLPRAIARMGYARDFHMLGQWFPKLAKLQPDGRFAMFPYHGAGEFFADFATYELVLELPTALTALCNGRRLRNTKLPGGRIQVRYRAANVHDLACAVGRHVQLVHKQLDHVAVTFMAPHGYGAAVERQAQVLRDGLRYFGQHYGPYPYSELAVVIPPRAAHAVSGMEYPGLIVTGGPWWSLPIAGFDPFHDILAAHELAHQWFYGLVASNEVAHPFMDEGLSEWATWDLLRHRAAAVGGLNPLAVVRAAATKLPTRSPVSSLKSAADYRPRQLGRAVYWQPALVLERIAETQGRERLLLAIGRYARHHRFGHPLPRDLFDAFDAEYGPGFSEEVLAPELRGAAPPRGQPAHEPSWSTEVSWFSLLVLFAQTLPSTVLSLMAP